MMILFDVFKLDMLTPTEVIEEAISRKVVAPYDSADYLKDNFSRLVEELQVDAYKIYLEAEQREGIKAIREKLQERISTVSSANDVIEEAAKMFSELDKFFLSLTQSRRPRAGMAFEVILKTLFKNMGYPFDEQQVINGKPDFLMPSRDYYERNAMDCIIFTAKRTLRERWRQIVTEGTRGLGFYCAIKSRMPHYCEADNVISFEEFFKYHLDPAVVRWGASKVI